WGHNAVLADSKIYFTGGLIPNPTDWKTLRYFRHYATRSKEFYYLDVSKHFKLNEGVMPWADLSSVSGILPSHSWSAFSLCGPDTLVMSGGDFGYPHISNSVFIYNIKTQKWNMPTTTNPPYNEFSHSVCDLKTGKMYIFPDIERYEHPRIDILDTITLTWRVVYNYNYYIDGMIGYTVTLLPNGNIAYIGGIDSYGSLVSMSKWNTTTAAGYLPTSRGGHSSVLTNDGRIIVYGGYISRTTLTPVSDDLVILDTTSNIFTWSRANVSTISPFPRMYHSAVLVDKYMIVFFGRNNIYLPSLEMNEVYILDTSDKFNYMWINEFIPIPTNPIQTKPTNTVLIVAITISIVLLILGI
ncbi:16265_t:CDS:2, partial [Entrophospora sp. SA101]